MNIYLFNTIIDFTTFKFACFLPKLHGKIAKVPADEIKEFEESLTAFLAPYEKNADATGYLLGDSITIGKI